MCGLLVYSFLSVFLPHQWRSSCQHYKSPIFCYRDMIAVVVALYMGSWGGNYSSKSGLKQQLWGLQESSHVLDFILVKLVHQHFGFTKESDRKEKKFKRISNFTVDDVTVLLCFEASCCSSVSWETMSQFLFTFEASRCTNGIEWSSQEANESWKKMLYFVNCNCLLWALSFTEVEAFQATRGHYAYDLY